MHIFSTTTTNNNSNSNNQPHELLRRHREAWVSLSGREEGRCRASGGGEPSLLQLPGLVLFAHFSQLLKQHRATVGAFSSLRPAETGSSWSLSRLLVRERGVEMEAGATCKMKAYSFFLFFFFFIHFIA